MMRHLIVRSRTDPQGLSFGQKGNILKTDRASTGQTKLTSLMTSCCPTRRTLAEQFASAARLYAESAVKLAILGKSGIDYIRLRDDTIDAQGRSEVAFRDFIQHVDSHQCGEGALNGRGHVYAQEKTHCVTGAQLPESAHSRRDPPLAEQLHDGRGCQLDDGDELRQ